jgi:hypothetical protein
VGHGLDGDGDVVEFTGRDVFQVVDQRQNSVVEKVASPASGSEQGANDRGTPWASDATVRHTHTSTLVPRTGVIWTTMRERPPRHCKKVGCQSLPQRTLTYVYSDQEAVIGPLSLRPEPHSYDLCEAHADRLTVPQGWQVVRYRPFPEVG